MCENPLDVLICQTCPEKVIENGVAVPTVVVIRCSRNEFSQCEFLRSLRPYHPLWGVSLRIADVEASCRNFQCGLRHVRKYFNSRFKLSTPLKAFIRAILINLTRGRAVRRARAAHEPPEVRRGVASSLRTKTCLLSRGRAVRRARNCSHSVKQPPGFHTHHACNLVATTLPFGMSRRRWTPVFEGAGDGEDGRAECDWRYWRLRSFPPSPHYCQLSQMSLRRPGEPELMPLHGYLLWNLVGCWLRHYCMFVVVQQHVWCDKC